jgi:hypothetical protein
MSLLRHLERDLRPLAIRQAVSIWDLGAQRTSTIELRQDAADSVSWRWTAHGRYSVQIEALLLGVFEFGKATLPSQLITSPREVWAFGGLTGHSTVFPALG